MKILAGNVAADAGHIDLDGRRRQFRDVRDALDAGVVLIHQELNLADNLDIGANVFLGREPTRLGRIDRKQIAERSEQYLKRVGLNIDPRRPLSELPLGARQLVEIAKALSVDANVLIFDEPTSSLTLHETDNLLNVIEGLRLQGVTAIYISHRLNEVTRVADEVTILRDGSNAGHLDRDQITHAAMVSGMVGRDLSAVYQKEVPAPGPPRLVCRGLRTPAHPEHEVDLTVHAGETVGIAGLVGAGRTELFETIFGVTPSVGGSVTVVTPDPNKDGDRSHVVKPGDVRHAIDSGLALVPEDRKAVGVILDMTIGENIALPSLRRHAHRFGLANDRRGGKVADEMMDKLSIKAPSRNVAVGNLSGGNQQKVVLGKWLATNPTVLLLDEPTRGVDIGAKYEIYAWIERLAADGVAILVASSDMEEVLGLADRVLVMHDGRITAEMSRDDATEAAIMIAAVGGNANPTEDTANPEEAIS